MRISQLIERTRIGLLGYGREGAASHALLRESGFTGPIDVFADGPTKVPSDTALHLGDAALASLRGVDVLVRSPGFAPDHRLRRAADAAGIAQTTATNVFLAEARGDGLTVIGITGSKGKTTTSTLANLLLARAGVPSTLVGNVGVPALAQLEAIRRERRVAVLEMSSYQCDDLAVGPSIGVILDLFPEHMDWHGSIEAYFGAKAKMRAAQREGDRFFYNFASREHLARALGPSWDARPGVEAINHPGGLHFADGAFLRGRGAFARDDGMLLRGRHNRANAIAAFAVTEPLGVTPAHLEAVLREFSGLPYRLQSEGRHAGILWINDSLSTAPEAASAALEALAADVSVLIVGGFDRGYDYAPLIPAIRRSGLRAVITLPETGTRIAAQTRAACPGLAVEEAKDLASAVDAAAKIAGPSGTCLFSPGAPSYNTYRSFEERGRHFHDLVTALDGRAVTAGA
ncbi:MAG TPA: UDP-N-acetylmuramoyl-L-alanine--D-glutamate ligase [Polyangiaceae bacterium]|jgi:UDP-N-acetylmuramoylalanine--D-glutamate ligase|nr:UDP-N-acetylmuramoyl-L-alanine--D-glutamate ligase [Polyangiaceae bacterium]